ncbi:NAD-dependent epimerase/dehydratase [Dactylonectria macrodidyma]|uniref:NAD-dependent epimerase/dehydratase n=1 Tax=Dactylonectria macrodidyma TaxID=307937 RepID=A0A9P9EAS7_9HYPO|nr:NAD-dependent epimerase/dehydratase [Dactylonectria macrodidyma]
MGSQIPSQHILITGGAGFVGQDLAAALANTSDTLHLTLSDVVEPPVPKSISQQAHRINTVKCDLTDPSVITSLFQQPYSAVYLLHGLMSGGAEANLELGWKVNWDSHRGILDHLRLHHAGTVVVFPSSLAVYGPSSSEDPPTSETTCPLPQSSYGAQKLMVESYLNDMSRRGLLDGRIVRLPTIIVRPGAPSAAASSFASGIVREPLNGQEAVLPVARDLKMWICSPETVVKNLILIKDVPASKFELTRVVNLPGISVTVHEILDALETVGGKKAIGLVKEERDAKVEAIVGSWPYRFDTRVAETMGMVPDVDLVQNVTTFSQRLQASASDSK